MIPAQAVEAAGIPEAAVIAAAEAVYGMTLDGSIQREDWLKDFRKALEAAAPHMLGEAWQAGYDIGCDRTIDAAPNPYGEPE